MAWWPFQQTLSIQAQVWYKGHASSQRPQWLVCLRKQIQSFATLCGFSVVAPVGEGTPGSSLSRFFVASTLSALHTYSLSLELQYLLSACSTGIRSSSVAQVQCLRASLMEPLSSCHRHPLKDTVCLLVYLIICLPQVCKVHVHSEQKAALCHT